MFSLIFVMGYRSIDVGVDDKNYLINYNAANTLSLLDYYSSRVTEPGFYLLNRLVGMIFDDFQIVILVSSFITIFLFYKAFEFEFKKISLTLLIFIFITTQYFYYFGIVRLGIAAAIIAYAYRFIVRKEPKKVVVSILIATLFHYSALFCFIFLFFMERNPKKTLKHVFKNNKILKVIVVIPILFLSIRFLVYPLITIDRYQGYVNSDILLNFGFLTTLPFLIIFSIKLKDIKKDEHYYIYYILFIVKVLIEIFSPLIGIGRMVWYVNITLCYLMCKVIKVEKNIFVKYVLFITVISYSIYYLNYAYFSDVTSIRSMYLIPYKNTFFEFFE
ncbi:hypothetical protein ASG02_13205 [Exiguobacterium sp. Leaf196]|nr:hypothetical protein ASG02_13205 [Exiguobacterium sp. Leaf196]